MILSFYLIRHGKTLSNVNGLYTGRGDNPLCQVGIDELNGLLPLIKKLPLPDILFSSPMKRAVSTAKIYFSEYKPIIIDNLREIDFGIFEGKSYNELKDMPEFIIFDESGWESPIPQGEDPKEFRRRCAEGFLNCVSKMTEKNIKSAAIVCHGGVIMSICYLLIDNALPFYEYFTENGRGWKALYDTDTGFLSLKGRI